MAKATGPYSASFKYTPAVLDDFQKVYRQKQQLSTPVRILFFVLGCTGVVFFGYSLYTSGLNIAYIGYLVICTILILISLQKGRNRNDDSLDRIVRFYNGKKADITINEEGVEMHIEGQTNYSKTPFKKVHGLFKTDNCYYIVVGSKGYYIFPKHAVDTDDLPSFEKYLEGKCKNRFITYDLNTENTKQ
jgi:hypothetical protein